MSIILDSDQYESFYSVISLLKEECNDIDIRDGKICQKSNSHEIIFDIDLSDVLQGINLPFTVIKQKIDLLRMFVGSDNIEIDSDDEKFTFKDEFSKITIIKPNLQFIDNPYVENESLSQLFSWDQQEVLLTKSFSPKICDRVKIISSNYNINRFQLIFNGDDATMIAKTESNDQEAIIAENIPLELEVNNEECSFLITPFIVDHDSDLNFTVYSDGSQILITKVESSIKGIDFTLYCRTQFIPHE